jgi:DNA invertase Pin-like site-specific DNA recombinase
MFAIGYIRVSSEEQADSGLGLEAQREKIKAYATLKGLILTDIHEDAGISGGKPLGSRPAGGQLLHSAKKGTIVIVAKLDRLFRSVADAAGTVADFDKQGIELVSIAEGFDMTNPYGRAMAQMASVFAELERMLIKDRTKSALGVKKARNERVSRSRYGWDVIDGGKLTVNAKEQAAIRLIRRLRAQGRSLPRIAADLNGRGVPTKHGKPWIHTSVVSILRTAS